MKKTIVLSFALLIATTFLAGAQQARPATPQGNELNFTILKQNPITPVKNQASSGTCWCFSTISFFESEAIRLGCKDPDLDLAEMFIVSKSYADKAEKFIRVGGFLNYAQGSSASDAKITMQKYGIVPEAAMPGLNYGETTHKHGELEAGLKGFLDAIVKNPNRKLTTAWHNALEGILAAYLGDIPTTFQYKGKTYTPQSYFQTLNLNLDDYIDLTSFTHHPFYTKFAIEVQDNWRWAESYNIPLDELIEVMYNAINNGYTLAWGADVSESGFNRQGLGTMKDVAAVEEIGSDQARWVGVTEQDRARQMEQLRNNPPEMKVTQEMRQIAFDNQQTTDDHGMHVFGTAVDQNGLKYFMVKNSWGDASTYKGIWYVTEAYFRYKTLNIMVHKDAIPAAIKAKLGIK
ncbi:MAG: aminopeptidase [Bacteroidales bacterium]|nr:aminopeptidase [Bacteroidales bacterium]